jgi:proteasome assembly chaperone (PAC2) family protein
MGVGRGRGPGTVGPVSGPLSHVRWRDRPDDLHRPVLVAAWEGWNDAGDAASTAARFVAEAWGADPVADIDPEEYFDFTSTRPKVRFNDSGTREVLWPETTISVVRVRPGLDLLVLQGDEPQLRWRTYCDQVIGLARQLDVRLVVTLGALLAEVPHTRPTPVFGNAYDPAVERALSLQPSTYEGPTGIVGVLHALCTQAGVASASLWAAVPTYVPGAPSPKAALALVEHLCTLLEAEVAVTALEVASASYERQVTSLVEDDEDTADYVAKLEERHDRGDTQTDGGVSLIAEVERFLRDNS